MNEWQPWVWHRLFTADLREVVDRLQAVLGPAAENTLYPGLLDRAESLSSGNGLIEERTLGPIRLVNIVAVEKAAVFLFFEVNGDDELHGLHLVYVKVRGKRSVGRRPTDAQMAEAQRRAQNP